MQKKFKKLTACALVAMLGATFAAYPIHASEIESKTVAQSANNEMEVQEQQGEGANASQPDDLPIVLPENLSLDFPGFSIDLSKESSESGDPSYRGDVQFTKFPAFDQTSAKPCRYDSQNLKLIPDDTLWAAGNTFYMPLFTDPFLHNESFESSFLIADWLFYPYEENVFLEHPSNSNRQFDISFDSGQKQVESISLVILNVNNSSAGFGKMPCVKVTLKSDPTLFNKKLEFQAQLTAQNNAFTTWGDQCADVLVAPYKATAQALTAQYLPMFLKYWEQNNPDSPNQTIVDSAPFQEAVMKGGLYLHSGTRISYQFQLGKDIGKENSTINITTGTMDKTYDGTAVDDPQITKTGSTNAPTFTYYQNIGNDKDENWKVLKEAPADVGAYKVAASVAGDSNYNKASAEKEFTISIADNHWAQALDIAGWTYGEQANTPAAVTHFGNVTFTYSDSEHGIYTNKVPTTAGTWYVKAVVKGTDNYTGMETIKKFTIAPKNIQDHMHITVSDLTNDKDFEHIIVKDGNQELVKGKDYDVEKKQDGNKVIVTITCKGNYTGTVTKTYTVSKDKPEEKPNETGNVQTDDSSHTALFATLSILSAGCIAFFAGKKRKRR